MKKSAKFLNIEERTSKRKLLNIFQISHDSYLILVHLTKINYLFANTRKPDEST